jgi:hypothetical protein
VYVDAGMSHARPPAGVEVDPATYALFGARFFAGPAFGSFYGALAADGSSADWIGGRLGASYRSPMPGRLGWAVTGVISGFSLGDPTPYKAATVRLVPEARLSSGRTAWVLRGYSGAGRSDVTDTSQEPEVSFEADLWMYGVGLETSRPIGPTQAWLGVDAYNTAGGAYYSAYVGSVGSIGTAIWGVAVRLWDTPNDVEAELNVSVSVPLGSRWSTQVAGGRSGPDPLLASPAGVDGSAVVSWSVLAPAREPPPVASLGEGQPTMVLFSLEYDDAANVSVIGDFSAWEPIALSRQGTNWVGRVPIEPGLYHFGFLVDGEWFVPEHAPGKVTDDFGRINATLVVPGSDSEGE